MNSLNGHFSSGEHIANCNCSRRKGRRDARLNKVSSLSAIKNQPTRCRTFAHWRPITLTRYWGNSSTRLATQPDRLDWDCLDTCNMRPVGLYTCTVVDSRWAHRDSLPRFIAHKVVQGRVYAWLAAADENESRYNHFVDFIAVLSQV